MCLWAIYIFPGSVHIFPPAEKADPSWEYINRSQTHECGNWDWGPDIPFLGIFVSNFRHFAFAVHWLEIRRLLLTCRVISWFDYFLFNKQTLNEDAARGIQLARNLKDPFPLARNQKTSSDLQSDQLVWLLLVQQADTERGCSPWHPIG